MHCNMCPRRCDVDRVDNLGVCGMSSGLRVAKAYLHKWEEPCISGDAGSGTIFFSGCNLKCVYCQNYEISSGGRGYDITPNKLAEIFRMLEDKGASNINLVSPSHYVVAIKEALDIYKPNIPIVYNSNGYDSIEGLEYLKGYIDIYLVDLKYMDGEIAGRYSHAIDYPEVAKKAILKMIDLQPENIFEGDMLKKGVIIRHLVLPNNIENSKACLKWIKDNVKDPIVSLMGQYTPMYKASEYPEINRPLKSIEYKIVEKAMLDMGLTNGYTQELSSATTDYTPIWDGEGVI
ncbi:MAG: radical SAM protein [Clostridiales bacterium]|nr:radical SAM protein [Clostridiales bacterium]